MIARHPGRFRVAALTANRQVDELAELLHATIDRAAVSAIESMHGFVLVRHGNVVAQGWWKPYSREYIHELYSLTKSFTSTAIGFAVQDKLLGLDDAVVSFFPKELPAKVSPNLAAMRIRHLLSMSTGHHLDAMPLNCSD